MNLMNRFCRDVCFISGVMSVRQMPGRTICKMAFTTITNRVKEVIACRE
jgi:hypothetical protein